MGLFLVRRDLALPIFSVVAVHVYTAGISCVDISLWGTCGGPGWGPAHSLLLQVRAGSFLPHACLQLL